MNNLTVNLENLSETERETLTALIAKANKPAEPTWMPEAGEKYWLLEERCYDWAKYTNSAFDRAVLLRQDPFKTEKEALKADKQRIAIVEVNRQVRRLTTKQHPEWVCDWSNRCQYKYSPTYDHVFKKVEVLYSWEIQSQFTFDYAPEGIYEQIDEDLLLTAMGIEK